MIDAAFVAEFRRTVDAAAERLRQIADEEAARPMAPGKWSRKEIIGHLIDSASNNHGRFVRAQSQDDMVFPGYDQDVWVRVQCYRDRGWLDLIALWRAYNYHLADVMASADRDALERARTKHNLDRLAFQTVSSDQPTTLAYLMRDYVAHLKHHLKQALPST